MKQKTVLSLLVPVLVTALATGCASSKKEGNALSGTPTQTAISATASPTSEEDIDQVIQGLVLSRVAPTIKHVTISGKQYYTDSSGTNWIAFDASFPTPAAIPPGYGIVKKAPGENWELVAGIGANTAKCDLREDVQAGLGFVVCQPDAFATASAASGEDVNEVIRDFVLSRSGFKDIRVEHKTYYTDSSGTIWLRFAVSPLPEGVTDPASGLMKKAPGGSWEGVAGPGTALSWRCDLPEDVQRGLGFAVCSPQPTPTAVP